MAGVRDEDLTSLGPWPLGVNNTAKEHALPDGALRAAVNMDIDKAGIPSRRAGRTLRVPATRAHSLFAADDHLLAVVDGVLGAYEVPPGDAPPTLVAAIRAGLAQRYVSAAQVLEDVYWSNGVEIRRFGPDLVDRPVWLANPPAPFVTAANAGGLAAGDYDVALTWLGADGRESGASPASVVTVPANGGITLSNLPAAAEGAALLRVYVSPPNGGLEDGETVLYHAADLPAGQPMFVLGAHQPGRACETQWLVPLPPGDIVRFQFGRMLVASGNLLSYGEPLRFGLMHQDSTLRFGAGITLMEPVGEADAGAGVFIADHKRTYFMAGSTPGTWQRPVRYGHAAVPGSSLTLPGTAFGLESAAPVAVWLARNGVFCLGLPGGEVRPLREGDLALPDGEHAAAVFREVNGIKQLFTSYLAGGSNRMGMADNVAVTVRRNGVVTD